MNDLPSASASERDITSSSQMSKLRALHLVATIVLATLLFVNAASPYLGLKWEFSFNMFGDLATDTSNHLFLPRTDLLGIVDDYYIVDAIESLDAEGTTTASSFLRLLSSLNHPAAKVTSKSATHEDEILPISGNALRYQIWRLKEQGHDGTIHVRHFKSDAPHTVSIAGADKQWTAHNVWNQYPVALHSYRELRDVIKSTN